MAALAASFESYPLPNAVADRTRFFNVWLRRIAPDTHQDQASGDATACRPGGFAAPEERWCRSVSNGCFTLPWLPMYRRQSLAGSRGRRSVSLQIGDGDTASNSLKVAVTPVRFPGLPCPVLLMRSSALRQMVCAPSVCGNRLVPIYARAP